MLSRSGKNRYRSVIYNRIIIVISITYTILTSIPVLIIEFGFNPIIINLTIGDYIFSRLTIAN